MEKGRARVQTGIVMLPQQMRCQLCTHVSLSRCKLNNVCQQLINTGTTAFCQEAAQTLQIGMLCPDGARLGQRWIPLTPVSSKQ